ncbi:alpha/beta hydrolase family protein [Micromonospora sp. CPCC 206061]|uniref:alpha/beta hydrolase family protein n=1 Tax=Micromonospora sp. CPCC 206061 TaxID=3122410 RepID=UPI002FF0F491
MPPPLIIESADAMRTSFDDPAHPRPVRVYLWEPLVRPADGLTRLILLSHGTGASGRDMAWLAEPLAQAGFLVAAVDHHGNNWVDGYAAPGFIFVWERPADLRHALNLIEQDRDVDWVGAAGFSAGGYAAAALVGVRLDPDLIRLLAEGEIPDPAIPEYPDAFEWLRRTTTPDTIGGLLQRAGGDQSDDRVQAAFLICPGDGGMSSAASLRAVTRPVEIRWADADVITPPEQTALRYLKLIGGAHGQSLGRHVEHHHLFPDVSEGADTRARAGAEAVTYLAQVSGLVQPP